MSGDVKYGESDPTASFQLYYRELNARVYGKTGYPTYALRGENGYTITSLKSTQWEDDHVQMENAALTRIGDDYYAAYTTAYSKIADGDEMTYRKLYLQRIEAGTTTDGAMTIGSPVVLRSLVTSDKDSTKDGVYKNGALSVAYEDPYFANLNFLTGKLGELSGDSEDFDEILSLDSRIRSGGVASTFLLFEMNGETLVVPEDSLVSITDENSTTRSGAIIPFFDKETAEELNEANKNENVYNVESAPVLNNVTFGVDGEGNITAVYTRSVRGTSSNALYMAKYDATANTWGNGIMLAMRDMTTYENSIREGWDVETTEKAFYDVADPAVFNFGKISVGIASSEEGESDRLLVITEGTLTALTTTTAMEPTYDTDGNLTGIRESGETVYEMATTNSGTYDTTNGIYALTFGAGAQAIGLTSISLSNYDFTPGSTLYSSVAFTNVGDTTLRGSEKEPLVIRLMMAYGSTGTSQYKELATWKVTESVASGQDVETALTQVTLPSGIQGDNPFADGYIYFTVSETTATGESTAVSFSTAVLDNGTPKADAACIVLVNKAELALEACDFTVVEADEDTVTLDVDIYVTNRGSAEAKGNTLSFYYTDTKDDGSVTEYPLTVKSDDLKPGEVEPLQKGRSGGLSVTLSDLPSMTGQAVTGTIVVPKSCFDTDYGTGSLNLVVTAEGTVDEHNLLNNRAEVSVEPTTLITAPAKLSMQIGSTLRIPVTVQTTTKTAPAITVTELPVSGQESCMSVLYYDSVKGALVVMPGREGEGTIRIADTATDSILDICYAVKDSGEYINIYNDNGIFTWYVPGENGTLIEDDADNPKWKFVDNQIKLGGGVSEAPYRNDLAIGEVGYAFSFRTFADSLELYFMGEADNPALKTKVTVSSDLEGFDDVELTSQNGTVANTVVFHNIYSKAHTVTVTVTKGTVRFDKMLEIFNEDMTIYNGKTAPLFTFSRDLPETASVKVGETVPLAIYFMDNHGLTDAMLDGKSVLGDSNLTQISDTLWKYDLTDAWTENGSHTIFIQNDSGMTTTRTITVEWFSQIDVAEDDQDPLPGQIGATLVDASGNAVEKAGVNDIYVKLTGKDGKAIVDDGSNIVISHLEYLYGENGEPESQYMQTYKPTVVYDATKGLYKLPGTGGANLPGEGVYRVTYTDPDTGVASTTLVVLKPGETSVPKVSITVDKDGYITVTASKTLTSAEDAKLTTVKVNGVVIEENIDATTFEKVLEQKIAYNGVYTAEVTDGNGNVVTASTTVTFFPMVVPEEILTVEPAVGLDENGLPPENGSVTVDVTGFTGGTYDKHRSTGLTLVPQYEIAIGAGEVEPTVWITVDVYATNVKFENLAVGTYVVYIRDANAPETVITRTAQVKQYTVQITETKVQAAQNWKANGSITVTAIGGMGKLEYQLTDATGVVRDWQESGVFDKLPTGTYTVVVRDSDNLTNTDTGVEIFVDEVNKVVEITDVVFTPDTDDEGGTITITATGGEGELEYRLTDADGNSITDENGNILYDWQDSEIFEGLPEGEYFVEVRDTLNPDTNTARYPKDGDEPITVEKLYSVQIITDDGGHIEINGVTVENGKTYYYKAGTRLVIESIPAKSNRTTILRINGEEVELTSAYFHEDDTSAVIESIAESTVIEAYFGMDYSGIMQALTYYETTGKYKVKHTITATAGEGGTISPEGTTTIYYGDKLTYTITPENGYEIDTILVDGKRVDVADTYTFTETSRNRTIDVTFKAVVSTAVDTAADMPFVDVASTDWYATDVAYVYGEGLMIGTDGTHFSPDVTVNRAMLVTILWRLEGEPEVVNTDAFTDVPTVQWYSEAVAWAAELGLVKGYGDGTFGPMDALTREQILVILHRYAGSKGMTTEGVAEAVDGYTYSAWAMESVGWAQSFGLLDGFGWDITDDPDLTMAANRAELAAFLRRYLAE